MAIKIPGGVQRCRMVRPPDSRCPDRSLWRSFDVGMVISGLRSRAMTAMTAIPAIAPLSRQPCVISPPLSDILWKSFFEGLGTTAPFNLDFLAGSALMQFLRPSVSRSRSHTSYLLRVAIWGYRTSCGNLYFCFALSMAAHAVEGLNAEC